MLDISWTELFVVAVVAILVIGPRDLPRTLRSVGNFVGQARRMAGDFQRQFDQALREAELDEVKKSIDSVRKADPRNQIRDAVKDVAGIGKDLKKDIENAGTGKTPASGTAAKTNGKSGMDKTAATPAPKTPAPKTPAPKTPASKASATKASAPKTPTGSKAAAKPAATKSAAAKTSAKTSTTKAAATKTAKAPARKSAGTAKKAAGTARSARAKSGSATGGTATKAAPAKS